MESRKAILDKLVSIKDRLYSKYPIKSMALFGSYSRNDFDEQSDIDIMVELDSPIGLKFITLVNELEYELKSKVDVVSRNAIKSKYFKQIERDLIYV